MSGYLYVLGSIVLTTLAQLSMKWGAMRLPVDTLGQLRVPDHALPLLAVATGIACYAASLVGWLSALRYLPLHIAYSMLSVSYALVYLMAVGLPAFGETLTLAKTAGVAFILLGAVLVGSRPGRAGRP